MASIRIKEVSTNSLPDSIKEQLKNLEVPLCPEDESDNIEGEYEVRGIDLLNALEKKGYQEAFSFFAEFVYGNYLTFKTQDCELL